MQFEPLTFKELRARPVVLKLKRPVVARIATITETAHWLERQDWADPLFQKPYEIGNGSLHIPEVPGVGLEWNEDAVAANLADL